MTPRAPTLAVSASLLLIATALGCGGKSSGGEALTAVKPAELPLNTTGLGGEAFSRRVADALHLTPDRLPKAALWSYMATLVCGADDAGPFAALLGAQATGATGSAADALAGKDAAAVIKCGKRAFEALKQQRLVHVNVLDRANVMLLSLALATLPDGAEAFSDARVETDDGGSTTGDNMYGRESRCLFDDGDYTCSSFSAAASRVRDRDVWMVGIFEEVFEMGDKVMPRVRDNKVTGFGATPVNITEDELEEHNRNPLPELLPFAKKLANDGGYYVGTTDDTFGNFGGEDMFGSIAERAGVGYLGSDDPRVPSMDNLTRWTRRVEPDGIGRKTSLELTFGQADAAATFAREYQAFLGALAGLIAAKDVKFAGDEDLAPEYRALQLAVRDAARTAIAQAAVGHDGTAVSVTFVEDIDDAKQEAWLTFVKGKTDAAAALLTAVAEGKEPSAKELKAFGGDELVDRYESAKAEARAE